MVTNAAVADPLTSLDRPFSVFSPGLAGIPKRESYVSRGVVLRSIARGDANLYLRNILNRLHGRPEHESFIQDLRAIFTSMDVKVEFDIENDEFIFASAGPADLMVPLEICGTGLLQTIQILSYIHAFSPTLIVLDEPDSHLHPNNQRALCDLLARIVEERDCQVIMATHSRHVIDALSGRANLLWVAAGKASPADQDDHLEILLDIGALDVRERLSSGRFDLVVCTEDKDRTLLKILLQSNGIDVDRTLFLSYHGVTDMHRLEPIVKNIKELQDARILLHRDRDYLTDEEVVSWENDARRLGVEPFVTDGLDVESYFCSPAYLAEKNGRKSEVEFAALISEACERDLPNATVNFINGRTDILRKRRENFDSGRLAVDAAAKVASNPPVFSKGKRVRALLRKAYQDDTGLNLDFTGTSVHLGSQKLTDIARRVGRVNG